MDSPEKPAVSSTALTTTGFYRYKLWGFIFLALELWPVQSDLGLGLLTPKISWFLSTIREHVTTHCHSLSIPSLPQSLCHTASPPFSTPTPLPPLTRLGECGLFKSLVVGFHKVWLSDSSGYYLFWDLVVILLVVAWSMCAYASILIRSPQFLSWSHCLLIHCLITCYLASMSLHVFQCSSCDWFLVS